jgi:hypothetical protein
LARINFIELSISNSGTLNSQTPTAAIWLIRPFDPPWSTCQSKKLLGSSYIFFPG